MFHAAMFVAAGFVVGCACPGVIRKIRAKVFGEAAKVQSAAQADAIKVAKKV